MAKLICLLLLNFVLHKKRENEKNSINYRSEQKYRLRTARQLLKAGYFIYLGSRSLANGEAAVKQLNDEGFDDVALQLIDVTDLISIQNAVKELSAKTDHLDVLINNAGISGVMPQNASETAMDNIRTVFETNFFGVIQTIQAFLPLLKKSAAPRIVNVSSDLGSLGHHADPEWQHYQVKLLAYNSSKTALNAFTVMLAYEFKDSNFKINSVNPGYTATDFNHHTGYKTVEAGAEPIVKYAMLDSEGPTGGFFSDYGLTPW